MEAGANAAREGEVGKPSRVAEKAMRLCRCLVTCELRLCALASVLDAERLRDLFFACKALTWAIHWSACTAILALENFWLQIGHACIPALLVLDEACIMALLVFNAMSGFGQGIWHILGPIQSTLMVSGMPRDVELQSNAYMYRSSS